MASRATTSFTCTLSTPHSLSNVVNILLQKSAQMEQVRVCVHTGSFSSSAHPFHEALAGREPLSTELPASQSTPERGVLSDCDCMTGLVARLDDSSLKAGIFASFVESSKGPGIA